MSITAMKMAVEALTESVDLVRNEYQDAVELYGCYPTRAARIDGLLAGLKAHEDAITALRTAIQEAEKVEPFGYVSEHNCQGPFQFQFHKEPATVYTDNCKSITAVYLTQPAAQEPCRTELVTALHTLASHYENKLCLFQDDEEAHRVAKGDIAHALKVAAKWNWNGAPAAQPAKPLTEVQIEEIYNATSGIDFYLNFARAIEAAHGIKEQP